MRSAARAPDFQATAAQLGGHCRSRGELRQHIMDARTSTASVALVDRPFVLLTSCSSISDRNPHTFSIPSSLASFVRARARCSLQTPNLEIYQREMLARLFALLFAVAPAACSEPSPPACPDAIMLSMSSASDTTKGAAIYNLKGKYTKKEGVLGETNRPIYERATDSGPMYIYATASQAWYVGPDYVPPGTFYLKRSSSIAMCPPETGSWEYSLGGVTQSDDGIKIMDWDVYVQSALSSLQSALNRPPASSASASSASASSASASSPPPTAFSSSSGTSAGDLNSSQKAGAKAAGKVAAGPIIGIVGGVLAVLGSSALAFFKKCFHKPSTENTAKEVYEVATTAEGGEATTTTSENADPAPDKV